MKRAQLHLKNLRVRSPRECPQEAQRRLSSQLCSVGWAERRDALAVAATRHDAAAPSEPEAPPEAGQAERVYDKYFGCPTPALRRRLVIDRAAERRRAWQEAVIARHQLPETGAELLVLEGVRHIE
jgi:hypothetical protein